MFIRNAFLSTALFGLLSSTALAGPATPEEATRLTALFQTYLSAEPGVVAVEPADDAYTVTLDFAPFIAKGAASGLTGTATPYVMTLTDNGDGTWATTSDQAFSAQFAVPGVSDISYSIGSWKSSGTFDEALSAFSASRSDFTDVAVSQKLTLEGAPPSESATAATSGFYESTAVAAASGGIDSKVTFALDDYSQTMAIPGAPDGSAANITVKAATYGGDATMTGLDPAAFYKLIAWFVAHPSKDAIIADQAGLKTMLTEGMPFFQNINSTGALENVTVGTPVGEFAVEKLGVTVEANGLIADGKVREGITLSGLSIPVGVVPEWATTLVPKNAAFDFTLSGFDAAAPVAALITAFDLTKPEPIDPAVQMQLMSAFMPNGTVDIALAPGGLSSDIYDLSYEGTMTAGPMMPVPTGKATVKMTGMEAVMAALQAGPPEMTGQIMLGMGMAQSMAKPGEGGALVWELDATTPGSVLVNGVDMMTMMGGQ